MENAGERVYMCIDLKSFYASVECVERGLDPFRTNLVVADPDRGRGTICLAVSPALKEKGVPGRCRLFEIPRSLSYMTARPRMSLYLRKSAEIVGIYLRYVAPDDLYVYSIDEVFIDATGYLRMYRKDPKELADMLRDAVFAQTGICATAGIGTNMFLAKVALDIVAKHVPDHIGVLDPERFRAQLWHHRPITDIWNIGHGTARKLERLGVYDLYGVTRLPEKTLYRTFGVNARYLIDHAWGRETCTLEEIRSYVPASTSLSNSQVLFRDYSTEEAELILMEMVEGLTQELLRKRLMTDSVSLSVGYSSGFVSYASGMRPSGVQKKLPDYTSSCSVLTELYRSLYRQTAADGMPVRRLAISFGNLIPEDERPLTLFGEPPEERRERCLMQSVLEIRDRYGKNAIFRGRDLESCATLLDRNRMIGGHRS